MKFKKLKRIKIWCKRRVSVLIITGIIILPFLIDALYHTILNGFLLIREDELLAYYGVSLGICVPVFTYFDKNKKEKESRRNALKPIISVDLNQDGDNNYTLTLTKISDNVIKDVYLYWKPIVNVLNGKKTFKIGLDSDYITEDVLD